jgi:hypothetical protein
VEVPSLFQQMLQWDIILKKKGIDIDQS